MSSLCTLCEAQTKMKDVFLQMPDSLLPYLTENNRLDFIDFLESGMNAIVTNELGGKSEMYKLEDDYLSLNLNPSTFVTMHLMPVDELVDSCNQVICAIITFGHDIRESKVLVYSINWRPLDVSKYLDIPHEPYLATDFLKQGGFLAMKSVNGLDAEENMEVGDMKDDAHWLKNVQWKPLSTKIR